MATITTSSNTPCGLSSGGVAGIGTYVIFVLLTFADYAYRPL